MDRTNGSLLCSAVSIVACLLFVGFIYLTLGSAIMANPGIVHLMLVLGR
jgi:hypothetical protein